MVCCITLSHVLPVEAFDAAVELAPGHLLPRNPPVELRHGEAALRTQLRPHRLDELLFVYSAAHTTHCTHKM